MRMTRDEMREIRQSLGLHQYQMSAFLCLAKDTVGKYETGHVKPSGHIILLYKAVRDGLVTPEWAQAA